jgi:hypothetical protein
LRTDEEIVTEMTPVLGFSRRGARIEIPIKAALGYRIVSSRPSPT